MRTILFVVISISAMLQAHAAVIPFDLFGRSGAGLLGANENPTVVGGGSGGELGTGILFDDVTLVLSINVGWGTANGFTDLTGNTTLGHLHGPTATPAFTENAGVR